jgi:hypothetical protein
LITGIYCESFLEAFNFIPFVDGASLLPTKKVFVHFFVQSKPFVEARYLAGSIWLDLKQNQPKPI